MKPCESVYSKLYQHINEFVNSEILDLSSWNDNNYSRLRRAFRSDYDGFESDEDEDQFYNNKKSSNLDYAVNNPDLVEILEWKPCNRPKYFTV